MPHQIPFSICKKKRKEKKSGDGGVQVQPASSIRAPEWEPCPEVMNFRVVFLAQWRTTVQAGSACLSLKSTNVRRLAAELHWEEFTVARVPLALRRLNIFFSL
jgi:hypothetical protein